MPTLQRSSFLRHVTGVMITGLFFVTGCSPQSPIPPEQQALSSVANEVLLPWHHQFRDASEQLVQRVERFCQNPANESEFEETRTAWRAAMKKWEQLEVLQFGPVEQGNHAWRIQFWPDSNNLIKKKIATLLAEEEPITPERLSQSSVVVQGLSALEYMLYDSDQGQFQHYQGNQKPCAYLQAASQQTLAVAEELLKAWRPESGNYVGKFLSPGPDNPDFSTLDDAVASLVSAMVSNVEVMQRQKVATPMGEDATAESAKPYKVEYWRSKTSLEALKSQLNGVLQLFNKGIAPVLDARGHSELARKINKRMDRVSIALNTIHAPLFEAVSQPEQYAHLAALRDTLGELRDILKYELPTALDIQLGFNSNDGD